MTRCVDVGPQTTRLWGRQSHAVASCRPQTFVVDGPTFRRHESSHAPRAGLTHDITNRLTSPRAGLTHVVTNRLTRSRAGLTYAITNRHTARACRPPTTSRIVTPPRL